jgi:hypothetical protein
MMEFNTEKERTVAHLEALARLLDATRRTSASERSAALIENEGMDEIDALYVSLRRSLDGGDEDGYQEALRLLRLAQEREAQQIAAHFDEWRQLKPQELDESLRRADDIIERHAGPSGRHRTAR